MVLFFRLREFGWRAKMTDTFMFFNRKGGDPKEGIDAVKFSPAAGVTFGTTYLPRKYKLHPGVTSRLWAERFHLKLERPATSTK